MATVHLDVDQPKGRGEPANPRYYISVVSAERRRACVDGRLPLRSDTPLPFPGLQGDTIVALARRIASDNSLTTLVFRYRIDTTNCNWIETGVTKP